LSRNYGLKIRKIENKVGYTISKERINHLNKAAFPRGKAGILNFRNEMLCNRSILKGSH
jgi:hypothetical protein